MAGPAGLTGLAGLAGIAGLAELAGLAGLAGFAELAEMAGLAGLAWAEEYCSGWGMRLFAHVVDNIGSFDVSEAVKRSIVLMLAWF